VATGMSASMLFLLQYEKSKDEYCWQTVRSYSYSCIFVVSPRTRHRLLPRKLSASQRQPLPHKKGRRQLLLLHSPSIPCYRRVQNHRKNHPQDDHRNDHHQGVSLRYGRDADW
jgi:hypothetical protein